MKEIAIYNEGDDFRSQIKFFPNPRQSSSGNNGGSTNSSSTSTSISNNINNNTINSNNINISGSTSKGPVNNCSSNLSLNNNAGSGVGLIGGSGTASATAAKNQIEQLNTMREALFSQDGWGCQHVNQDTNWEVPGSPEPVNKDPSGASPLWKPTINNGTDLWESNLRNGGQPTAPPVQKTPWGHTPSSNLGGTWGEDDDGADTSSVWTGSSGNAATAGSVNVPVVGAAGVGAGGSNANAQWSQGNVNVGVGGASNAVGVACNIPGVASGGITNPVNNSGGGTNSSVSASGSNNGWGDPRDMRSGPMGGPIDMRNVDPRDPMRAASAGDPRDLRLLDPRDPIRGDPRGISGRLNGTSEMWGQHHPITHSQIPAISKMGNQSGGGSGTVGGAVVASGVASGVGGMGPVSVNAMTAGAGLAGNPQWGAAQTVVGGPKDINAMGGKQVTGWEEPSPPPQRRNIPNYDDGTSLWSQQSRVAGSGSHWKDSSDQMNRGHLMRNNLGVQNAPNPGVVAGLGCVAGAGMGGGGSQGNNISASGISGNTNNPMVGVGPQGRLSAAVGPGGVAVGVGGQHKNDGMWVHPSGAGVGGRNNAGWGDDNSTHSIVGGVTGSNWVEDKTNQSIGPISGNVANVNSWNDPSVSVWSKHQNKVPGGVAGGWGGGGGSEVTDINSDWSAHMNKSQQQKLGGGVNVSGINIELIKQSKQYRILVESGFKKEDVERALLNTNMSIEEAAELLRTNTPIGIEGWRRHDDSLGSYAEHSNPTGAGVGSFPGRYPTSGGAQPSMSFPPNNLLNNMGNSVVAGGNNPSLSALNAMQPLQMQKYLNQQASHNLVAGPQSVNNAAAAAAAAVALQFGQGNTNANVAAAAAVSAANNSNNQPSAHQLRMLVQQIQLAVQSGYLSSQILNQPLAPTTLLLLNQLLSNIKHLQGAQQSITRGNNNLPINVAIAKYKQQIQNLQNQINAQQSVYIKQQHQHQVIQQHQQQTSQQHSNAHVNNANTEYLRGQHDAISALQSGGYQSTPNQQSRLNQWKLPVLEKDLSASDSTDFSRAPGTTKQNLSGANPNSMGPLGLQSDGTWSTGRNIGDGWPDPSHDNENKDWSVAQATSATAYTDLVQEFEPGKPWKIKSIEDDPSITPGSVARSPLSINPTPKESDIFANASKNSPTDLTPLSLSSSTWSFNPTSNNQNFPSWSDNTPQCPQSELWSNPIGKTSRGPPPGLSSAKCGPSAVGVGVGGAVSVTGTASVGNTSSVINNSSNGWLVGGGGVGGGNTGSGGVRGVQSANNSWAGSNSTWNSNWLLLKNLTNQIDGSTLRTLCMQHGPLISFHLYLNQGIALCKYATREEANKAQMTLNNCPLGNTTICAESPSENEVQNILQHLPPSPNGVNSQSANGNGGSSGNGNGSSGSGSNSSGGSSTGNGSSGSASSGNGSNGGGTSNGGVNSVINGVNNSSNGVLSANGGSNSGASVQSSGGGSSNVCSGGNNGGPNTNAVSSGNGSNGNGLAASNSANNSTWRQTQQNQSRPNDREADFDYISKFVCSIMDD